MLYNGGVDAYRRGPRCQSTKYARESLLVSCVYLQIVLYIRCDTKLRSSIISINKTAIYKGVKWSTIKVFWDQKDGTSQNLLKPSQDYGPNMVLSLEHFTIIEEENAYTL